MLLGRPEVEPLLAASLGRDLARLGVELKNQLDNLSCFLSFLGPLLNPYEAICGRLCVGEMFRNFSHWRAVYAFSVSG